MAAPAGNKLHVISAARFTLMIEKAAKNQTLSFSELGGINSKVSPSEYVYSDQEGNVHHTKQYGKTEPPTVTLKRALDTEGNETLFAWHALARMGNPEGRGDCILTVTDAGGEDLGQHKIVYKLIQAWCQELTVAGVKAGDTGVVTIEAKLACSEIIATET